MGTSANGRPSAGSRTAADPAQAMIQPLGPSRADRRRGQHSRGEEARSGDPHGQAQEGEPVVVRARRPGVPAEHQHHDRQGAVAEPHQCHRGQRPGGLPSCGLGQMTYALTSGRVPCRPVPPSTVDAPTPGRGPEVPVPGAARRARNTRRGPLRRGRPPHRSPRRPAGRRRRDRRRPSRRAFRPWATGSWPSPGARSRRRGAVRRTGPPGRTG